jgi:hypothetical protein
MDVDVPGSKLMDDELLDDDVARDEVSEELLEELTEELIAELLIELLVIAIVFSVTGQTVVDTATMEVVIYGLLLVVIVQILVDMTVLVVYITGVLETTLTELEAGCAEEEVMLDVGRDEAEELLIVATIEVDEELEDKIRVEEETKDEVDTVEVLAEEAVSVTGQTVVDTATIDVKTLVYSGFPEQLGTPAGQLLVVHGFVDHIVLVVYTGD